MTCQMNREMRLIKYANLTKKPRKIGSCPEGFTTSKRINCLKTDLLQTAPMCLPYIKYMRSVALKTLNYIVDFLL